MQTQAFGHSDDKAWRGKSPKPQALRFRTPSECGVVTRRPTHRKSQGGSAEGDQLPSSRHESPAFTRSRRDHGAQQTRALRVRTVPGSGELCAPLLGQGDRKRKPQASPLWVGRHFVVHMPFSPAVTTTFSLPICYYKWSDGIVYFYHVFSQRLCRTTTTKIFLLLFIL